MTSKVDYPTHEIDLDDEGYQFDIVGVWVREDGYYLSTDSGCSCPSPWESHTEEDLTGPLTWEQAKEELTSIAATSWNDTFATREVEQFITEQEVHNA